jgi:hypothetical protein
MVQPSKNKGGRPRTGKAPTLDQSRRSEGFYNHREVADLLGIHPDTVHSLTRINRIPVERRKKGLPDANGNLRHDLYYPKADIDALRDSLTVGSKPRTITQEEQVNGTSTLNCNVCNEDVPLMGAVAHEQSHKGAS